MIWLLPDIMVLTTVILDEKWQSHLKPKKPAKECMKVCMCKKVTNFDNALLKFCYCTFSVVLQFVPAQCLLWQVSPCELRWTKFEISIQSLNSETTSKYYLLATDELGALWNWCEPEFLGDVLLHRVAPLINTFSYCTFQQSTSIWIPWVWLVKQVLHQAGLLMLRT